MAAEAFTCYMPENSASIYAIFPRRGWYWHLCDPEEGWWACEGPLLTQAATRRALKWYIAKEHLNRVKIKHLARAQYGELKTVPTTAVHEASKV
jgi:hypothetical protein